jgi:hypothetical protein
MTTIPIDQQSSFRDDDEMMTCDDNNSMIETPIFGDKSTKHQHYDNGGNVSTMK